MKRRLLAGLAFVYFFTVETNAVDSFYAVPNSPEGSGSRLTIRSSGIILVDELYLDDEPFAYFRLEEVSGNPLVFWLTKDKFAFLGCGGPHPCDNVWRVGSLEEKSHSPIQVNGFNTKKSWPVFHGPYMAYSEEFTNGNKGCSVYDWSTGKHAAKWDSGSSGNSVAIQFSVDSSVTCHQITGWIPLENYGGDGPSRRPIYGKKYAKKLDRKSPK